MLKFGVPLALALLLGVFLFVGLQRDPSYVPSPLIGKPAPEFTLPSLQDPSYPVASKELAGKTWVLNVWGTWCGGCRQEHETLMAIARTGAVPLVGLNWKDDGVAAQQWLSALGNPYAVVASDPEGRVAIDWGVYGAPETFLIGPDGKVLFKHIAPMTMEVWTSEFLPRIQAANAGIAPAGGMTAMTSLHFSRFARTVLMALLVAGAVPALAIDTERAFDDPALQARYETIGRELRCLVCQNQTIADSNATLAQDLRREVREMIAAGKTDDEIRTFMVDRYGDFVLYKPRMTPGNFLLWAAPVLLLLLGTFVGIRIIRKQAAQADTDGPEAGQS